MTTLTRLVAGLRGAATQRLWNTLADLLDDEQRRGLGLLLQVPDGARVSDLDRLKCW
ncbi:hypothetical protein ABN034_32985 [Actinopolymorpha sp. B11F2]|uniref:hypothetical protein n=1 Tax=Actinopolymorpha sp. B11F2 TaxID=3160862 RepID=UPI0032E4BB07